MFQTNFFHKESLKTIACVTVTLAFWSLTFMVSPKTNAQSIETSVSGKITNSEWVYEGDTLEVDLKAVDAARNEIISPLFTLEGNIVPFKTAEIRGSQAIFIAPKGTSGGYDVIFRIRIGGREVTKDFNVKVKTKPILKVPDTISFYEYEKDIEVELKAIDFRKKEIPIKWKFAKKQEEGETGTSYDSLDTENFQAKIKETKDKRFLFIEAKPDIYEEERLRKGKIVLSVDDEDRLTKNINVDIKPLEPSWFMGKLVKTLGWRRTGHTAYDYFAMSGDAMIFLLIAALILAPSIIWKGGQLYWWIFRRKTGGSFIDQYLKTPLKRLIRPGEWEKEVPYHIIDLAEKKQFDNAIRECEDEEHPVASVLKAAIRAKISSSNVEKEKEEEIEEEMGKERDRQEERLGKWFWAFDMIIAIAPMLGFLGTITGLIMAFRGWMADLAAGREVDMANLAGGMYQAMVTTFVGLFIAIYAIFFNGIYRRRFEKLSAAMIEFGNKIAEVLKP